MIVVGDCNTGKTSLVKRLTRNTFSVERKSTLLEEIEFFVQKIKDPMPLDNKASTIPVGLEIWDTLG